VFRSTTIFGFVCALLLVAFTGNSQTTNASIYGSVLDSSGAAVPKAVLPQPTSRLASPSRLLVMMAGVYNLSISASLANTRCPGKCRASARQSRATSNWMSAPRSPVDLKLEVGATSDAVTVESSSSPLETVNIR